jgi:hypothetical protein
VDLEISQRRAPRRCDDSVGGCGKVWEGKGGVYPKDCQVAKLAWVPYGPGQEGGYAGHAPHAHDSESEEKLWGVSSRLVGLA